MAWISSSWGRIAVGETHSGSITSQKEAKVARNINIRSFYMDHSPAKERWPMFKTGASAEAGWDTKTTHGTQSGGELYSEFPSGNKEHPIVWLLLFCSGIQPPYSGVYAILKEAGGRITWQATSAKQEALQSTAIGNAKHSVVPKLPIFP